MLRLISDADVHGHIVRGVRGRNPGIDLVRAQEVGLRTASDAIILDWAAGQNRIVISQDRTTMIGFACARIAAGLPMPGLFVLRRTFPRHSGARAQRVSPESRATLCRLLWIPGSPLRGAPE